MKKVLLFMLLAVLATTIGFSQTTSVTFQVQNPPSTPVYVFGSWSNWSNYPGDAMTAIGNNTYSITLPLTSATNYEYLYVNNATPVKEVLSPAFACTNGNAQYTNRTLTTATTATQTLCNIWETCNACQVVVSTAVQFPVTFEDPTVAYDLTDFGGNASSIVTDPTNPNNKVVATIKDATAQLWAGTTLGGAVGFGQNIPFTATNAKMNMRVWSPDAGIQVRLKVEDANDPTKSVETEATTTVANGWQTLTFDFANQAPGTAPINLTYNYRKASAFFNFGTTGAQAGAKTYYWDDVQFGGAVVVTLLQFPVTFEDANVPYNLTDFGGNASSIVTDPTNPNNKVVATIKDATAQLWAGTTLGGAVGFAQNIPFTAASAKMNMRVWSPDAGIQIRLKVEDANDPTKSVETEATTTVANAWQTLTFDFANQAAGTAPINLTYNYRKASAFFNFGTTGAQAGAKTYYWDDVQFGGAVVVTPLQFPVTFEDANVPYNLTDFGGNASSIVTDPTNPNNKVVQTIKGATAELWAGTTLGGAVGFAQNIPFTATNAKMNMRVWSPDAGIQIRLKVEDANDPTKSVETEATTTVANAWQTLTFDFANQAAGTAPINLTYNYRKASAFFNFGTTGAQAGAKTYYWDDVLFGSVVVVTPLQFPVTFEDATVPYNLIDFGGNASSIVTDPTNPNNKVVQTIKGATAELWAGTTLGGTVGFGQNIPFTATDTKMNMRVWSPDAGIQVRLKVEDPNDPTKSVETEATTTAANTWQTLTFDFANQAAGTAPINLTYNYRKASAFFNFGTTGAQAGVKTYYWDDVLFGGATSAQDISKNQVRIALNKNGFTLLSDELKEVDNIVICDVVGRAVYTSPAKVAVNTPIDVTLNSNTVYFITVKTNNVASTFKAIITQ